MAQYTGKTTDSRLAVRLAALASLGAAVVHVAVVPSHWQQWVPSGLFFLSLAVFQAVWSWKVLVHTTIALLSAGVVVNAGALALWAMSRTAGPPFGPNAGHVEVIAGADVCAMLLQLYVVMGAGWVWYRGLRGAPVPAFASAAILLGAVGVVTMASTVGVASGLRHGDHHGDIHDAATTPPAHTPVAESLGGHSVHSHGH